MRHHFKWYLATQVLPEWKQRKQVTEERRAQGPRTCWEAKKREGQVGQHLDRGVPWTQPRGVALGHGADWIQGILFLPDPDSMYIPALCAMLSRPRFCFQHWLSLSWRLCLSCVIPLVL